MYRTVNDSIWSEPWFEDLSAAGRFVFLHLLTSPRQTPCGVLEINASRIGAETGLGCSATEAALHELEAVGKVRWWPALRFIFVTRFYRWQRLASSESYTVAARKAAALLPPDVQQAIRDEYPELVTLTTLPPPSPHPGPTVGGKETATATATVKVPTATRAVGAPAEPDAEPAPLPVRSVPKPKERERGWVEKHPLWPAVTELFGRPAPSQFSTFAQSLKDLDALAATPAELRRRHGIYPAVMGTAADGTPILLTLRALVKHWAACARAPNVNGQHGGPPTASDFARWARQPGVTSQGP